MLVASSCLVVIALSAWVRLWGRDRPLDRNEVRRINRFSEKLRREESLPFE
jgi:hypothetical protein